MGRTRTDPTHRQAVGARLRTVLDELGCALGDVASAMGYRDGTTLSAARSGRVLLEPGRLVRLARWSADQGKPLDLHWLLTGEGAPWRVPAPHSDSWLTSERLEALRVLARGVRSLPEHPTRVKSPLAREPRSAKRKG